MIAVAWIPSSKKLDPFFEEGAIALHKELSEHERQYEDAFPNKKIEEA